MKFILTRKGKVPLEIEGEAIAPDHALEGLRAVNYLSCDIYLIRAASGRLVLYVGSTGSQRTLCHPQIAYLDAQLLTVAQIIEACGGYDDARRVIAALDRPVVETFE